MTGSTKSRRMNPNAPMKPKISPKNDSIAAITAVETTVTGLKISLGTMFLTEHWFFFGSACNPSAADIPASLPPCNFSPH